MLTQQAKAKIASLTKEFAKQIQEISPSIEHIRKAYPFHAIFFSEEATVAARVERTTVTKMGQQLYPELARIIAASKYKDVSREKEITFEVPEGRFNEINRICSELREGRRTGSKRVPNHGKEMAELRKAKGGRKISAAFIADLFVTDFEGGPLYYEIKSPMPNLDICEATKRKLLLFHCFFGDVVNGGGQGYLAFPYNPYICRSDYAHSFTKRIMDLSKQVLMGAEMWDKLGGRGTFQEMLTVMDGAAQEGRR